MQLILAQPRGFCAGVKRAIETVERALELFGKPVYVRHEIVHNTHVVNRLKEMGAIFIEELDEVPSGSVLIFSAHGVSQAIRKDAGTRQLKLFDATCPLVTKVHVEVAKNRKNGREIIVIGHKGHPEVEGTMGQADTGMYLVDGYSDIEQLKLDNPDALAYVSQTTLSVDDTAEIIHKLKTRFPSIVEPKQADICYATTNRQEAVKRLAEKASLIIVVGSRNSSNSNRLREIAEKNGAKAYMVDNAGQIDMAWLEGHNCIGITAGASAPEILVQEVVFLLQQHGGHSITEQEGLQENLSFPLPKGLK
ncbi:4-hydroxy-3-methylbut-2-enyl diphosphate reductase [Oxalobacter formigenes]|uniref:4-hydroxy-3-methylbut-2-enyl diphosphate reductase n=1 Tax=Oxalobacter formigenes OXCC13 TaxID=556269 RepID=C3X7N1_OXAFO|nr:4-hydroxy-3-methylbut-2-enyl diphosphate reductase [Oxalobacter formigenes]ARQ46780.1 4-hydroxy-3-methylbut-2-enyl diphosphate reductase [Oxalobacter formigenes]ARQ78842.1 4-hydroxy-3-methylbut-2-enyl diphosphate reductase [Oxalobacter formigenes OXCC13]EEO29207.1 4-hydroxy-3-methylbut-2-enyl diphosphate reductase [Oxalobacter formigenes OXCC13]MCZ4062552.1 4-hydroxy-3-methylbut-2-enyl diphosphate reductase [Oxalobacter formigenes]QDX32581.1 4-hydroxy-3-methylbut-2-enyl diphosphate reductas